MDKALLDELSKKEGPVLDPLVEEYLELLPKFMVDNSVGKIAKHLRLLGTSPQLSLIFRLRLCM